MASSSFFQLTSTVSVQEDWGMGVVMWSHTLKLNFKGYEIEMWTLRQR
jgi:hypothetical protein